MHVRPLSTREEFERYVDFAADVYRDNQYWVPLDKQHLMHVLAGEAGFGPGSKIHSFWVEDGDKILARVTALNDEAYDRHWQERMGHLLFFEALPHQDLAVNSLFTGAGEWLQAQGCNAARLSLLPGLQMPLTIDAYDTVPTIFHTFNPSYYHSYIKNNRFTTELGVVQYQIKFTPELTARYHQMVKQATDHGISLRAWDLDHLESETEKFAVIGNETFSGHFGFMPLPLTVYRGFTVEFKDFLLDGFTVFAEVDGQAVGFVYSVPDLNQALHPLRGKAIDENLEEFGHRLKAIDHGVLLIIGVRQDYRGRGINLALAAKSYLAMIDRGYKTASYTVVLDDNWPSRRTAEKLGGQVTRNFNLYRKELG